jgi:hypothetical protein
MSRGVIDCAWRNRSAREKIARPMEAATRRWREATCVKDSVAA